VTLIACTTAEDINRIQPNVLAKSALAGEWYHKGTIVDKQFSQSNLFVGVECNVDRIRFEIGKDMLIAYRSYEKAIGTEVDNPGKRTMVAAFPVQKHFDIKRGYNPVNGVQNNVIEENEDRPWDQREYMHVDFSTNLVPDSQCNDWIRLGAMNTIARNTNERPEDPWRVRIGDGYIESTTDAMAGIEEGACLQISDWNCAPSTVRMKLSFRRVNENDDYVRGEYPDTKIVRYGTTDNGDVCFEDDLECKHIRDLRLFKAATSSVVCDPLEHNIDDCEVESVPLGKRFGFFLTERDIFDREKGFTVQNRKQYINRWNIWKQSTHDDGTIIPIAERIPKTIVYYLNPNFPPELWDTAKAIGSDWNTVFSNAVAKVRSRCSIQNANTYIVTHHLEDAMIKHGFPAITAENLSEACKMLGVVSEHMCAGDVFMSGDAAQVNRLFGKMVDVRVNDCTIENAKRYAHKHDLVAKLTERGIGDINQSSLESACAVLEWVSERNKIEPTFSWQQIGDLRYSFLNWSPKAELEAPLGYGPASVDPLTGQIIGASAHIYGKTLDSYAAWAADIVMMVNGSLSGTDVVNASLTRGAAGASTAPSEVLHLGTSSAELSDAERAQFMKLFGDRANKMADSPSVNPLSMSDKHAKIMRRFDEYLMNQEMVSLFSGQGGVNAAHDKDALETARPSNWARPAISSAAWLSSLGVLDAAGQKMGITGTSTLGAFQQKIDFLGRHNACFHADMNEPSIKELAEALKGKSWDEVYKTIREQVLRATALHEMGHNFGLRHNFKASADALNYYPNFWKHHTGDHLTSSLTDRGSELKTSSIMDYAGRFNGEFGGLGPYDNAAILAGYVHLVEIFDEQNGPIWPVNWGDTLSWFHYKDLPILFAGGDADKRIGDHYNAIKKKYDAGDLSAKMDLSGLNIEPVPANLYKRTYMPMEAFFKEKAKRALAKGPLKELLGQGPHDVPYMYCSDTHADSGDMFCNRFDSGASAEEIVDSATELYDSYYLLNNFRRDRTSFNPQAYLSKTYTRVYQPMLNAYRAAYGLWKTPSRILPVAADYAAAAQKGINFFGRVLQMVEPGDYCLNDGVYEPVKSGEICDLPINIGVDQGRYYDSAFSDEFFFKTDRIGHMYDKILAIMALSDDTAILNQDFYKKPVRGTASIGYYRMFGPELVKLMSAVMRDDLGGYMPRVKRAEGKAVLHYVPLIGGADIDRSMPEIRPSRSYALQNFATVLPMLYFSSGNDTQVNFASRARVSLSGSKHDPVIAPNVKKQEFMDPNTMMTYVAFAAEGDEELAPGYKLLKEANAMVNPTSGNEGEWYLAAKEVKVRLDKLKVAIGLGDLQTMGSATDAYETAQSELKIVDQKLTQKIQQIDLMRQLSDSLQFGN
jgi:hypothetical protein